MGDEPAVEREIFIAAPPATVFEFFRDPVLMVQWLGRGEVVDPRPGGAFRVEVSGGNIACGTYVVVDPPHRIAFTWGWEQQNFSDVPLAPGASLVEIELEPKGEGTLVRLRHRGLPDGMADAHRDRWMRHLQRVQSACRTARS
jgi:uncharacterized protein YndB with AHSA1/START domain